MMEEAKIKTNSVKAWLLAARPKTLSGAAVPVMISVALAYSDARLYDGDVFSWTAAVLCLLFSFTMQIITTTAGTVITGTSAIAKTSDAAGAPVRVTFNGTTVTASNPQIATAAYAYTGDPTIDPNDEGEFYYADITLTIATV